MELTYRENGLVDTMAMLENNLEEIRSNVDAEHTLLWYIAFQNEIDSLDRYVELGLNINVRRYNLNSMAHHLNKVTIECLERLIEHGLNIHAINLKGENALLSLAKDRKNPQIQSFLIEKGLNPYNKDFNGRNCFLYIGNGEMILNRFNKSECKKPDFTVDDFISRRLYDLALNEIYLLIDNMGGLNVLIGRANLEPVHKVLQKLQDVFMYKGMVKEASAIFSILVNSSKLNYNHVESIPFSFVPSLIEGDMESVFNFIEEAYQYSRNNEKFSTYYIVLGHMLAQKFGDSKQKAHYKRMLMNKPAVLNYYTKWMLDILRAQTNQQLEEAIEYVDRFIGNYHTSAFSEIRFLQSFYYVMTEDYLSAEVMYRDIVQNSVENGPYNECSPSLLLIDYLQDKLSTSAQTETA